MNVLIDLQNNIENGISTLVIDPEGLKPWERQPGENTQWYKRFLIYLQMEPPRSVRSTFVYEQTYVDPPRDGMIKKNSPESWFVTSSKFRWKERAELYDLYQIELHNRQRERAYILEQKGRDELRELSRKRAMEMLQSIDVNNALDKKEFGRIVEAAMKINEDSRREFGDNVKRTENKVDFTFATLVRMSQNQIPSLSEIESKEQQKALSPGAEDTYDDIYDDRVIEGEYIPVDIPPQKTPKKSTDSDTPPQQDAENSDKNQNIQSPSSAISENFQNDPATEVPIPGAFLEIDIHNYVPIVEDDND